MVTQILSVVFEQKIKISVFSSNLTVTEKNVKWCPHYVNQTSRERHLEGKKIAAVKISRSRFT